MPSSPRSFSRHAFSPKSGCIKRVLLTRQYLIRSLYSRRKITQLCFPLLVCFIVPFDFYYQAEPNESKQKHADPAAGPKPLFEAESLFFVNFLFLFSLLKQSFTLFFHFRAIKLRRSTEQNQQSLRKWVCLRKVAHVGTCMLMFMIFPQPRGSSFVCLLAQSLRTVSCRKMESCSEEQSGPNGHGFM